MKHMFPPDDTMKSPSNPGDFDASIRRTTHDGETYFSLVDIMAVFSDTATDAKYYWRDTKKRLEVDGFQLSEKISQLKLTATDGKQRLTDCATAETCLRIIQSIPSPKAEPIRAYMAKLARERLEEEVNPELGLTRARQRAQDTYQRHGKKAEWIDTRLEGVLSRKAFTAALAQHVQDIQGKNYGDATNALYTGLWGRSAKELKEEMGLKKSQSIRDNQPRIALHFIGIAEAAISHLLGERDTLTWQEAEVIINQVSAALGIQVVTLSELMKIDIATGKKLLGQGDE